MKALVIVGVLLLALTLGLALALLGAQGLVVVIPLTIAAAVFFDYRIGVILLIFMLPLFGSRILPVSQGLNPLTYALVGTTAVFFIRKFIGRGKIIWPPRVVFFCMILPIFIGLLLGLPHLHEAVSNLTKIEPGASLSTWEYFRSYGYRPLTYILFAFLLANAIVDSRKPERFIAIFAASAMLIVLYLLTFVIISGASLGQHRIVISKLGLHYNGYGKLLALAFGPLLYVAFASRGAARLYYAAAAALITFGIMFTFARAGVVASIVVLSMFLWQRKSGKSILALLSLMMIFVLLVPDSWTERMFKGSEEIRTGIPSRYDNFTSGRLGAWIDLAPDVARSPVVGRGSGSTLWNSAVTAGLYPDSHPHNMYLAALLDIGLIGLIAILYLYFRMFQAMSILSRHPEIGDRMRAFFGGAAASFAGMMVLSFTGGLWYPEIEQSFLWIAMGFVFAYWSRTLDSKHAASELFSHGANRLGKRIPLASQPWRQ